ncbi:YihY/virulence factor BrkB family protein [Leifsonia sp. Root4]|uniref:YihY/virulence factor BrkB family protein n=1 Tax=Leifsonia sp. Root4 TaxID=1736525 RepID=UPI0009EAFD96|nr:YihY/virulence factor BrkB family protein [Leifsonia sp. Root4]
MTTRTHPAHQPGEHGERPDEAAPHSPTALSRAQWRYVLARSVKEFRRDRCLDQSAALAFRSALVTFPTMLVLVSLLGMLGETSRVMRFTVDAISSLGSDETADSVRALFAELAKAPAGYAFALGLVLLLWSASGYVTAFGRAMNSIYGVSEGRTAWKLRVAVIPLGALLVLLLLLSAAALLLSGEMLSDLDLSDAAVLAWNIVRVPLACVLAATVIALLYYFSPNIKHPRLRWMSVGAAGALTVWVFASLGLTLYFANFSSFDRSYGAIGGALVFLIWLWLSNFALLLGGEFDAELERMRQLRSGRAAEANIFVQLRNTSAVDMAQNVELHDVIEGRAIKDEARRAGADHTD